MLTPGVNHKRVYRLYSQAQLAVRKRKKVRRAASERVPLTVATHVNEVWSMDFGSDSLANGRRIKCLTVADDFSHECVDKRSPQTQSFVATRCQVCMNPRRHVRYRNGAALVERAALVPRHATPLGKGRTILTHHVLRIARQLIQ